MMEAPTGSSPASELPKSLWNILDVLLRENGLQSWQVYSQKNGLSVRLRFGEAQNGTPYVTPGNSKTCYTKKSPSQMKRDAKKAEERRITRQQTRSVQKKNDSQIEMPRGENDDTNNSPVPSQAWSISPVNMNSTPDPHSLSSTACRSDSMDHGGQSHAGQVDSSEVTTTITQSADLQKSVHSSTPRVGLTRADAAVDGEESGCSGEEDSDDDDVNRDRYGFGPNLSLPRIRYAFLYPRDRRCSYCGAYKGSVGKTIMECTKDGRKVCLRCYKDSHVRHRKYFVECTTNYVHDGDSDN